MSIEHRLPLVSVNILTWNRRDIVIENIHALKQQTYPNVEIIVVDNASADGTSEEIRRVFPEIFVITMKRNVGIAGWNHGFRKAKGKYVVVLDDDAFLEKDAIEKMVQQFEKDRNLGAIGTKQIDVSTMQMFNWGSFSEEDNKNTEGVPHFTFNGQGAAIRTELFGDIGYFDEDIFIYFHEVDFAIRVLNAGYKVKYFPNIVVYHDIPISRQLGVVRYYYGMRNKYLFLWKYFPIWFAILLMAKVPLKRRMWRRAFQRRALLLHIKAYLCGISKIPRQLSKRVAIKREIIRIYGTRFVFGDPLRKLL